METYPKEIEVERMNNVAKNFGWELIKQETIGEDFLITFKKKMPLAEGVAEESVPG